MSDRSCRDALTLVAVEPVVMPLGNAPSGRCRRPPPVPKLWAHAIAAWVLFAREEGLATTSIRTRREHLERCGRTIRVADPFQVDGERLREWFEDQPWQRETRRSHRTTLRVFYRWAAGLGLVERSPALMLPKVRPGIARPNPLPDEHYWRVVSDASARDLLMVRLAAELGMRRMEVAGSNTRDLLERAGGWSMLINGKGDRERIVPVPENLTCVLRSLPMGWIFPGDDRGHLSPRWVGKVVGQLLPPGFTMHSLRHLFATRAHPASGYDLLVVQQLLGHASVATTQAYVKVLGIDERLRATVNEAAGQTRAGPRAVA